MPELYQISGSVAAHDGEIKAEFRVPTSGLFVGMFAAERRTGDLTMGELHVL